MIEETIFYIRIYNINTTIIFELGTESTGSEGDSTDSSKSHEAGSTTTRKKRRTR